MYQTCSYKDYFLFKKYLYYKTWTNYKYDIIEYLDILRKPDATNPTNEWIDSYNTRWMTLSKFFRWYYNQNKSDNRKRITPPCMQGIKSLAKARKFPYKQLMSELMKNKFYFWILLCGTWQVLYHSMANNKLAFIYDEITATSFFLSFPYLLSSFLSLSFQI